MKALGWLRRKLGASPIVCPALAVVLAVAEADQHRWYWVAGLLIVLLLALFSRPKVWLLTVVLAGIGGGLHAERLARQRAVADVCGDWWAGPLRVVGEQKVGRVELEFQEGEHQGQRVQAWLGRAEYGLQAGDLVQAEGRMIAPRTRLNPDVFPEKEWLQRKGIQAVLVVRTLEVSGPQSATFSINRLAETVRNWMKSRLVLGGDPADLSTAVVNAMVLGERPADGKELIEDFRKSGTIHVFAVSGLHVMMVGSIVAVFLRLSGCPRGLWIPVVIGSLFFYALVTGMRPPALRAALMGAVLLSAWLVRRRIVLLNSVAISAVVVLIWDGHLLFQAGFQLSFAVLVAIALLGGFISKRLSWVSYMDPFLPRSLYSKKAEASLWMRRKVEGATVVGSCAWCGSSPLTWWHFGLLTPLSILISLPMVLILYAVLMCSAVSLLVGMLWQPLGEVANNGARMLAGKAQGLAASGAGYHYAETEWSTGERVVVYAMPEGESAVYVGLAGGLMLDAGSERGFRREVLPSLVRKGARVDSLIISHTDVQHSGGVAELASHFQLKQVVLPEGMRAEAGRHLSVTTGATFPLGDSAWLEVVYADAEQGRADDRCAVLRLHWRDQKILFVNDAGYSFEQWVARNRVDVRADVLVIGKHASDYSGGLDFMRAVSPSVLVAPRVAVKSERWLAALAEQQVALMVLEETGAVEMRLSEGSGALQLSGFVAAELGIE